MREKLNEIGPAIFLVVVSFVFLCLSIANFSEARSVMDQQIASSFLICFSIFFVGAFLLPKNPNKKEKE